jgi:hypothetical protein
MMDLPLREIGLLPTQTPTPTPTSTPTSTSTPTDTPRPTPSFTLTPTLTPTAVNTPTPELAAGSPQEIRVYVTEITEKGGRLSRVLQSQGELLQNPQLNNQGWKKEVAAQVAAIRLIRRELIEMAAIPLEMIGVHSALLDAISDCDKAMYFLSDVDNLNSSDIKIASRLTVSCGRKFSVIAQRLGE